MRVLVSIVSFNTKELLRECLLNLTKEVYKNEVDICVLDNDSKDLSAEMIEKDFKKVSLIKSNSNLGFAKGQNVILKRNKADYILVLNPDTKVSGGSIDKMVEFMESYPDCGIASCKIYDYEGRLQSNGGDLPFGFALFCWLFNLEIFYGKSNFHRTDVGYYQTARNVGWVGGTFMMIRKEVIEKVHYFNEDYFMYFEDVDYCYRASKRGFKIMINPEVSIKHLGGASSNDPRLSQWRGEFWGLKNFYKENVSNLSFLINFLVYLGIVLRIISFAVLGRFNVSKTYGKILFNIR